MTIHVDVWLRGNDFATTASLEEVAREPQAWTDEDVRLVLEGMLRTMHRLKYSSEAGAPDQPIALRGLSWIVNPYDEGGVVIAIEITMGAAVAGPFDIEKAALETMISRVLLGPSPPASNRVH